MTTLLIDNIFDIAIFVVCIYGIFRLFQKSVPLYFKLSGCAAFCYGLLVFYNFLTFNLLEDEEAFIYVAPWITSAVCGLLYTCNSGNFDKFIDDKSTDFKKSRMFAVIGPIIIVALYALFLINQQGLPPGVIIGDTITVIFAAMGSYTCLKYLLIKDKENTFLIAIKPLSFCSLMFSITIVGYVATYYAGFELVAGILYYLSLCFIMAIVFASIWGKKKWIS